MARKKNVLLKIDDIKPGMFKSEKFIDVRDSAGISREGIFPDAMMQKGALKVVVMNEKDDKLLIAVPTANGYGFFLADSFWVNRTQIVK